MHALVDGAGVVRGVAVEHLGSRAGGQAQVVDVAGIDLGLAGVQPEDFDAVAVIIGLELPPEKAAGVGVGGVVERNGEGHSRAPVGPVGVVRRAGLAGDQVTGLEHGLVVGR